MATRDTFSGSSTPPVSGPNFLDQNAAHLKRLYDAARFPLTSIGGTANAVTATLDPVLDSGGLVTGMCFGITWAADNTGAMTLAINGGAAVPVVDAAGGALSGGAAKAGTRVLLEYVGTAFRIISSGQDLAGNADPYFIEITASTTWNKPSGYADDAQVVLEAVGAGGGGGRRGGGGGGGYNRRVMRYADVPSSLAIGIGAGGTGSGTTGTAGGNTTVGSLLTAWGGGPGGNQTSSESNGGGGGGEFSAGSLDATGNRGGGSIGGGHCDVDAGVASDRQGNARTIYGGGAGGSYASVPGGNAVHGGAGGAGDGGSAGLSLHGGNGGAPNTAGSAPGGGGGGGTSGGNGARGVVRISIGG